MIRKLTRILSPVLQKLYFWYVSKPRRYSFKSIQIIVNPGVFYPGFIKSTRILLNYLDKKDLSSKKVLELGAGCGIISILAASKGAIVTASDINPLAVENIHLNAGITQLPVISVISDLLLGIAKIEFDYIIINPPFYAQDPKTISELAWYCGSNFEYYFRLF